MLKSPGKTLTYIFQSKKWAKAQKNIPAPVMVKLNAPNRTLAYAPSVTTLFHSVSTWRKYRGGFFDRDSGEKTSGQPQV